MSKLIRPGWMPRHALDLRYRAFERVKHGIRCIGTWLSESEFRSQPCLVLVPANKPIHPDYVTPIAIPLNNLWVYAATADIGDRIEADEKIESWLNDGLLPGSPESIGDKMKVLDCINTHINDVKNMPPRPRGDATVHVGIGRVTHLSSGKVNEFEVTTDV